MKKTYYQIHYRRPCDIIEKWFVTGLYPSEEQASKAVDAMLKYSELYSEIKIVPIEINT